MLPEVHMGASVVYSIRKEENVIAYIRSVAPPIRDILTYAIDDLQANPRPVGYQTFLADRKNKEEVIAFIIGQMPPKHQLVCKVNEKNKVVWVLTIAQVFFAGGRPAEVAANPQNSDIFTSYERGVATLLDRVSGKNTRYNDILIYQQRLVENIKQSRQYGDNEMTRSERAQIIEQLNKITLSELNISFNELCNGP